jgi:thioredoxin reductase
MTGPEVRLEQIDVAILGGGPAGLQAALVLSRTRKKIIVLDDPEPPRNAASHGVHNFLGLDGLLPADIREIAWEQIDKYASAELREKEIVNVRKDEDGLFLVTDGSGTSIQAKKVIIAFGYHDVYPGIPGFVACWADTIIPCPFCDGYENRDRVWGVVANSKMELERFPEMVQNWTPKIEVFIPSDMEITSSYQDELSGLGIAIHRGSIVNVNHTGTKVESVSLDSGERIAVNTLFWIPPRSSSPLLQKFVENLGFELDGEGNVKTVKCDRQTQKELMYRLVNSQRKSLTVLTTFRLEFQLAQVPIRIIPSAADTATGLRLYFDAVSRTSMFDATFS